MTAAISASRGGGTILLLESLDIVGKKILVTGNGRCNMTNLCQEPECYRSETPDRAWRIFSSFNEKEVISLMKTLGLCLKDRAGYVYPYNDQAAAVREAFEIRLASIPALTVLTGCRVSRLFYDSQRRAFCAVTGEGAKLTCYYGKTAVITTGGLAGNKLGCQGDGYTFGSGFGHTLIRPGPALTALCSKAPFLKKISGVRSAAGLTLLREGLPPVRERGEMQWTDYGISGICVFNLSRFAVQAVDRGIRTAVSVDLMPDYSTGDLQALLDSHDKNLLEKDCLSMLHGMIPLKLAPVILREAEIDQTRKAGSLSDGETGRLCQVLKGFVLRISGYKSFDKAQVTMGGIDLKELTDQLESRLVPGLYFAGEVTDVDGICGGYNLQWAFSSGWTVGAAIISR